MTELFEDIDTKANIKHFSHFQVQSLTLTLNVSVCLDQAKAKAQANTTGLNPFLITGVISKPVLSGACVAGTELPDATVVQ